MSIKDSFNKLLDSLAESGIITVEQKSEYLNTSAKLDESVKTELENKLMPMISDAVKTVTSEFDGKIKSIENVIGKDEKPAENTTETETANANDIKSTVEQALKDFMYCLKDENVKAFNDLVETFTDEQKNLFKVFISGEFCEQLIDNTEPETVQSEQTQSKPEDNDKTATKPVVEPDEHASENTDKPATEVVTENVDSDVVDGCTILARVICKLKDIINGDEVDNVVAEVLGEASELDALAKKYEREYAKLMKKSIYTMNRKNREFKLTGGVTGGAGRINNVGEILTKLRKQLYLSESNASKLASELASIKLASEAEKRDLTEQTKLLRIDNENLIKENADAKENLKLLTEQVASVKSEISINEAKAFLAESVADLPPKLKLHLINTFGGKEVSYVKTHFNEAVEAFRENERVERSQLKKSDVNNVSRMMSEAVGKQTEIEMDPFVNTIAACCGNSKSI